MRKGVHENMKVHGNMKKILIYLIAVLLIIGLLACVDSYHFCYSGSCLILVIAILISGKIDESANAVSDETQDTMSASDFEENREITNTDTESKVKV